MHLVALIQLVIAASDLLSAALLLLRSAASRFFAPFDDNDDAPMFTGAPDPCVACGDASRHKCSRCKQTLYCSQACQSKHWNSHKLNCKTSTLLDDKADTVNTNPILLPSPLCAIIGYLPPSSPSCRCCLPRRATPPSSVATLRPFPPSFVVPASSRCPNVIQIRTRQIHLEQYLAL